MMNKKPSMDIAPRKSKPDSKLKADLDLDKEKKFNEALGGNDDKSNVSTPELKKKQTEMPKKKKKNSWKNMSKKQKTGFIAAIVVLVVVGVFLIYWFGFAQRGEIDEPVEIVGEEPTGPLTKSPLTGLDLPTATAEQTPMAIVIENLTTVRPQLGLSKADVVYEFLAEGGITRFLAIFAANDVEGDELLGPVRSLRAYFVPVGLELLAPVYHVGGAPNALQRAREWGMRDINQFFDSKYFWRDNVVNGQGSPHNMWTQMPEVKYAIRDHSWPQDDGKNIRSWEFGEEASVDERGEITRINVPFSSGRYNVTWEYDEAKNRFMRFQGEYEHHLDRNNDEQLSARNVVVQYCETGPLAGDDGKSRLDIKNDEGEGDALAFFNGEVIEATWKKEDRNARTIFYERGSDKEIEFIPGNFWVEVLPTDKEVTWESAEVLEETDEISIEEI